MGKRQGASRQPPRQIADGHIGIVDGIVLLYYAFVNSFIWLYLEKFCGSRQDEEEPEITMLRRWCIGELRLQDQ